MCKYCEGNFNEEGNKFLLKADKCQTYIFDKKIIVDLFDIDYFVNIKFCPMCGEKL